MKAFSLLLISIFLFGCMDDRSSEKSSNCWVSFTETTRDNSGSIPKFSMGDTTGFSLQSKFDSSRKALAYYLEKSDSSYSYIIGYDGWTGSGQETKVTIRNGAPVQRAYHGYNEYQPSENCASHRENWDYKFSYVETVNIGSHLEGDSVKTLEALYDICARAILNFSVPFYAKSPLYFELDSNHIIRQCWYYTGNIAVDDHSFAGIKLRMVAWN